ncbi:MAG: DNA-binding response regulator [Bacteroidetes bacterium 4484_249]|nr:MAG: DNA-binding response regulator [Bacteroidetes bacterium 4484_249]
MKCIIVDDESPAIQILSNYVSKMPVLQLVDTCDNAMKAIEVLHKNPVDLIFLDIHMPGMSGLDFIRSLKFKPLVILITAYPQYALEGFELDVVDYLLKPVSFERFVQAVNKALERTGNKSFADSRPAETENRVEVKDYMFVKADYKLVKVIFNKIVYIEGLREYVRIHTTDNQRIITLQSLRHLEEMLPEKKFIRIHKSYIVAIEKINAIVGNSIEIGKELLPIGKSYKENVLKVLSI